MPIATALLCGSGWVWVGWCARPHSGYPHGFGVGTHYLVYSPGTLLGRDGGGVDRGVYPMWVGPDPGGYPSGYPDRVVGYYLVLIPRSYLGGK